MCVLDEIQNIQHFRAYRDSFSSDINLHPTLVYFRLYQLTQEVPQISSLQLNSVSDDLSGRLVINISFLFGACTEGEQLQCEGEFEVV